MDTSRIDALIQLALVTAASNEDWRQRQLGPIHLIKYVYLADLAYAKNHEGETYTGTPWRFHHFGPWANPVYERIDSAAAAIGAERLDLVGEYGDFTKWRVGQSANEDDVKRKVDFVAALGLEAAVREFGANTEDLLHHVYSTLPMLNAAPGEDLDFSTAVITPPLKSQPVKPVELSKGQQKRREANRQSARDELRRRFANHKAAAVKKDSITAPRYDDVFFAGVEYLDSLDGPKLKETAFTCSISDEIWKSKARYDPDID